MLKKLIKYDLKKTGAVMVPICVITALVSLVFYALYSLTPMSSSDAATLDLMIHTALSVIAPLYVITRYYIKSLYTKEAYLLYTLPASNKEIVSSKIIVTCIWAVIFMISMLISAVLFQPGVFIESIRKHGMIEAIPGLYSTFVLMLMGLAGVMAVLFSICIGQLLKTFKTVGSLISCFVFGSAILITIIFNTIISASHRRDGYWGYENLFCIANLICPIIFIIIFYFATVHITTRKLNLD
ncbi:hypothetical protein D6853_07640 [Butyrivibrio sp. X503]|uniref:hypothetical protein n=1 Tax=Butyrivibrio sp. X503 TaxID=2364878 RepID=UPI000EA86929|nr:hypothetical protein [Butyrivibrio sp. X503]RKM56642.1 hypothetical protein D6853_07640 [Butyrivibrio sp. X503]